MDEFETEQISFLRQQDGPPERELKDQLTDLFIQNSNVLRAYLSVSLTKINPEYPLHCAYVQNEVKIATLSGK
jgi:hypothetical protein